MMEGLKAALEHVEELARENEKTEVIEICGKTYANKSLKRYDMTEKADAVSYHLVIPRGLYRKLQQGVPGRYGYDYTYRKPNQGRTYIRTG